MGSSHVMVLPSIEDGFGMVIGQAMAAGCPVFGVRAYRGTRHDYRRSGWLHCSYSAISMCSTIAMQQIAEDPEVGLRLREAAMKRVEELGGWRNYGDRWEKLLKDLTGAV